MRVTQVWNLVLAMVLVLTVGACSSYESESVTSESGTPASEPAAAVADAGQQCTTNADCEDDQYCAKPVGECGGGLGQCVVRPEICTQDWTPVCGCDGKTYGNACGAAAAGQNVDYEGECRETG